MTSEKGLLAMTLKTRVSRLEQTAGLTAHAGPCVCGPDGGPHAVLFEGGDSEPEPCYCIKCGGTLATVRVIEHIVTVEGE